MQIEIRWVQLQTSWWFGTFGLFSISWDVIPTPLTLTPSFFRGEREKPPTSNCGPSQMWLASWISAVSGVSSGFTRWSDWITGDVWCRIDVEYVHLDSHLLCFFLMILTMFTDFLDNYLDVTFWCSDGSAIYGYTEMTCKSMTLN